jgi:hypothetical protein
LLDRHLRHVRLAAWLCRRGPLVDAGLRASAAEQPVFDDLVELGLARGRITSALARGLARELTRELAGGTGRRTTTTTPTQTRHEERASCES